MKKFTLVVLAAFAMLSANAQDFQFGVEGGYNATFLKSKVKTESYKNTNLNAFNGFNLGPVAKLNFNDNIALKASLQYHFGSKSDKDEASLMGVDKCLFRMHDIQLPIDFMYTLNCGLYFMVGPKFDLGIVNSTSYKQGDIKEKTNNYTGKIKLDGEDISGSDPEGAYNRFNVMLNIGIGFNITENIYVQAAYDYGFLNLLKNAKDVKDAMGYDTYKVSKNDLTISVGYLF